MPPVPSAASQDDKKQFHGDQGNPRRTAGHRLSRFRLGLLEHEAADESRYLFICARLCGGQSRSRSFPCAGKNYGLSDTGVLCGVRQWNDLGLHQPGMWRLRKWCGNGS